MARNGTKSIIGVINKVIKKTRYVFCLLELTRGPGLYGSQACTRLLFATNMDGERLQSRLD